MHMKIIYNRELNYLRINYSSEKITQQQHEFQVASDLQFKGSTAYTVCHAPLELDVKCCIVVVLLFYVHGKHLRSCRDGQLT